MPTLPLTGIVDVSINTSAIASIRNAFNKALIIGPSTHISQGTRIKEYAGLSAMIADGFLTSDAEYKAAAIYFAQSPTPQSVFIGTKPAGDTLLVALTDCRDKSSEWYVAIPTEDLIDGLADVNALTALATYVESAIPSTALAVNIIGAAKYIPYMTALKTGGFRRTISMYDSVAANAGKTAIAGIIGYAMGNNIQGAPAFTLAYKSITGIEAFTSLTSANLTALLAQNGNVYINQASYYNLFRQGIMANGVSFDEVLYLDMLTEKIKENIMIALTTLPKIPQTNEGVNILTNTISEACEEFVESNFLAPGKWTGPNVLNLQTNDTLSNGYLVQFTSLTDQLQVDREARKAPNCYVCLKVSGAIEHVVIAVTVNR